ncbi:AAA family ATPase [Arthrobacter woluwensis]|uniref:AAA family ATPase n=1 Tax=Arthrobacter woluwensis TaxID=156980 RepID=UPI001FBBD135|nr:ATP-binding protein [Arthrobacter woluwensis]
MNDIARPFGREPELAEVLRLLTADEVPAVFVAAAPGMGVTTLLRRLFGTLSATRPVLSLHGTPALTLVNYGVLAVLRGMDSLGALSLNPTPALKVLRAHFRAQRQALGGDSDGPPPVVVVDEADSLDPASSDLFASLVMEGDIALVASYDARRPLSGPLSELWGMGLAEEVGLEPLDRERTRSYAREALGAPLLPGLEWKLWQDSGGSPMLLNLLLSEARRNGGIALRREVWVATAKEPWSGEGLHAIVEERLASLSLQSHHALNAVALGGTLRGARGPLRGGSGADAAGRGVHLLGGGRPRTGPDDQSGVRGGGPFLDPAQPEPRDSGRLGGPRRGHGRAPRAPPADPLAARLRDARAIGATAACGDPGVQALRRGSGREVPERRSRRVLRGVDGGGAGPA